MIKFKLSLLAFLSQNNFQSHTPHQHSLNLKSLATLKFSPVDRSTRAFRLSPLDHSSHYILLDSAFAPGNPSAEEFSPHLPTYHKDQLKCDAPSASEHPSIYHPCLLSVSSGYSTVAGT